MHDLLQEMIAFSTERALNEQEQAKITDQEEIYAHVMKDWEDRCKWADENLVPPEGCTENHPPKPDESNWIDINKKYKTKAKGHAVTGLSWHKMPQSGSYELRGSILIPSETSNRIKHVWASWYADGKSTWPKTPGYDLVPAESE